MLHPLAGEAFGNLLSRLISVTRDSYAAVGDLAREIRYRYYDHPLFERVRRQVYDQAEEHLAYLEANL